MLLNVLALVFITVAFGLGIGAVLVEGDGYQFGGDDTDLHHQLGLALFILVFAQVALGLIVLFFKQGSHASTGVTDHKLPGRDLPPTTTAGLAEKHWTRWIHMVLGGAILAMLYWQAWDGLHNEWPAMSEEGTEVPLVVQVLFWVIVLLPIGPYVIHLLSATCRVLRAEPPIVHDVGSTHDQANAGYDGRKSQQGPNSPRPVGGVPAETIPRPDRVRPASNPNPFEGGSTPNSAADGEGAPGAKVAFRMPSLLGSTARPRSTGDSIPMTEAQTIAADAGRRPALKFKERPV